MSKKLIIISFIALIVFVITIGFLTNESAIGITAQAIEGASCNVEGADSCSGDDTLLCINGKWENLGPIPGPDGCVDTGGSGGGGSSGNNDSNEGNSPIAWVIIVVLVILIFGVIGYIIYAIIKKQNKSRNPKLSHRPHPMRPTRTTSVRPTSTIPKKPISTILKKPVMNQTSTAKPPARSNSNVKRFTPPKR